MEIVTFYLIMQNFALAKKNLVTNAMEVKIALIKVVRVNTEFACGHARPRGECAGPVRAEYVKLIEVMPQCANGKMGESDDGPLAASFRRFDKPDQQLGKCSPINHRW